jgi:hypothetical protein
MSNRNGLPWSTDDIELLDKLVQTDRPLKSIARELGRSETAVKHAITKLMYQQLIGHSPFDIAMRYNKPVEWVLVNIVDPKYLVCHDDSDDDSDDDDSDDDSDDEIVSPYMRPKGATSSILLGSIACALVTVLSTSLVFYGYTLCTNGFAQV